ncbi:molybdopterin-dependent oxidoreductase [Capillimicrobium parvum]|uniref:Flavohemoprotein n=1 Tax=Capillimicrobium parvum TaxID=2884022 RepID=A0A9E6Y0M9_9ACTN|nr:molybdopterin-dependent oxidoreductase [Capillimicrobium parvum]UGS38012.1 Flavohemoprotein [Capillimicrobium parvum]
MAEERFTGRPPSAAVAARLPPGQHVDDGFPILTVGPTPAIAPDDWRMTIDGHVDAPVELTLADLRALPRSEYRGDIHCVTAWSKLDTSFTGVSVDALLDRVTLRPGATHAIARSYGGYTTNLPLGDLRGGRAWVVWEHEGRPLARAHGGPVRLLVPHRYLWKSAKWLAGLRVLDRDEPGFHERHGYHNDGDPWREERYSIPRERREWQTATVVATRRESAAARTLRLAPATPAAHVPGQHYDVRLSAPGGYTAERSYSAASSPLDGDWVEITVDRLEDGEVSPHLHDHVVPGDRIEVRGPVGNYFTWRGQAPLLLVGGGSGVVPLMAMLRHARHVAPSLDVHLLYSVRAPEDLLYRDELGAETTVTYTRRPPPGWTGLTGRLTPDVIAAHARPDTAAFVCGSHGFVDSAAQALAGLGLDWERIRTERWGPAGPD